MELLLLATAYFLAAGYLLIRLRRGPDGDVLASWVFDKHVKVEIFIGCTHVGVFLIVMTHSAPLAA